MRSSTTTPPTASEDPGLAHRVSPRGVPLHAHLGIVADRRRRLLLHPHPQAPQAWRLQVGQPVAGRHHPLRPRPRRHPQTFCLDKNRQSHPRQARSPACTFRDWIQCTSCSHPPTTSSPLSSSRNRNPAFSAAHCNATRLKIETWPLRGAMYHQLPRSAAMSSRLHWRPQQHHATGH